jgi:four helix bundle protein
MMERKGGFMAALFCFRHDSEWLRTPGRFIDLVPMMPYQRLNAWRSCHQLALTTYRITQSFPKYELYGITSQMRRAAFSAPANIAEGSAKRGPREFRRFLDIALGSLAELSYAILFAKELGFLSESDWKELDELRSVAGKLTWGLYRLITERGA